MDSKTAVLLLAYGGPDKLEDVPAYLLDIRGGRETPQELVDEITHRYGEIGGRSPLLEITNSAAAQLQAQLGMPVYVGMRHWYPYIKDVVAQMAADGVEQMVVVCMAPHYSSLSIGAYRKKVDEALAALPARQADRRDLCRELAHAAGVPGRGGGQRARHAAALLSRRSATACWSSFRRTACPSLSCSAASRTTGSCARRPGCWPSGCSCPDGRWMFSYQSAAKTGVPWLGPQIEDLVAELAQNGERNLLIAPIGFIADHVEVLYDIDIGVQDIARRAGVRVERPPMLNDSPAMVATLAAIVQGAAGRYADGVMHG